MEITRNTDHDIMTLDGSIPIARTESMKGWLLFLLFPFSLTTRLGVPVARNNPTLKTRCTSHVDVYKIAATMIDMPYQHPHSYKRVCFGNQPFPHQLCDDSIP